MRLLTVLIALVGGAAWAGPGDALLHSDGSDPMESLAVIDAPAGRACAARSGVCLFPGARSTAQVEATSAQVASRKAAAPVVPRFVRSGQGAWVVELQATLKRAALAGNALFIIFDADDPEAVAEHQYTAMYQTAIRAGRALTARLAFSPDEGFRAGRAYRIRVVQLLGGKEVELTEADLVLQ
jgi:hypothetical protein